MAEDIALRRKRLRHLAYARGMLEVELVLRPFADHELKDLDQPGLDAFERLLQMEDLDLWEVISGRQPIPESLDKAMITKLRGRLAGKLPVN